ncbi:hypothetical protein FSP39_014734 [Pinctada imbricata]|uniref:Major facilitator superfamily (MFS) profile domain-containing protein n=1 Tax=Pinctada imbricata TaxID=66713 RepID=A0AA88Y4H1_PINIB|nr:hypothetical protein FSP39_014734 [Pinctada imbricata]
MGEKNMEKEKGPAHPIDRGWAWLIFAACMLTMCLNCGVVRTFGVLFVEFRERYHAETTQITLVVAVQNVVYGVTITLALTIGLQFLTSRQCVIIGGILCSLSFILSGRTSNIYFLMFSYGILYGISMALTVAAVVLILGRYFDKHRGLVNGCSQAASSFGTLILAPTIRFLIDEFGFSGGLLLVSAILAHCIMAAAFMRPPELYKSWRKLKEKAAKRKAAARVPLLENENEPFRQRSPTSDSTYSPLARKAMLHRMRSRSDEAEDVNPRKESESEKPSEDANVETKTKTITEEEAHSSSNLLRNRKREFMYCSHELILAMSQEELSKTKKKKRPSSVSSHDSKQSESVLSSNQENKELGKHCLKSVFNLTVLKNIEFLLFVFAFFFGCSGSFLPTVYIPDVANDNHISKRNSAMLVSVTMAFDVIGRCTMGILSDRKFVERKTLIIISMIITGSLQQFLRFFTELWSLIIYCIVYGLFGGTIIALYAPVVLDTLPMDDIRSGLVLLQIGQGISWAIANLVSGILRDLDGDYSAPFHFLGAMCLLSAIILIISKCCFSKRKTNENEFDIEEGIS